MYIFIFLFLGFTLVSKWISYDMFKVRTVSLGRILTFSTAVLYLGYLWYKRKRTSSHRQSDKKRPGSETSELIKIDDQELFQALEKASRTSEVSQTVEEEPIENSVIRKEIMEPTISEIVIKEAESFIDNPEVNEMDTKYITMSSEPLESKIISKIVDSLTEDLNNLKLSVEVDSENKPEVEELNVIDPEEAIILKKNVNEEKRSDNKACWMEMVEKEDHCECPKATSAKKIKKDEEPMLFEGIKFKGKKKRNRKKNQAKDIIQLPTESHIKNTANNIVKLTKKKNQMIEEDCDSALSVDHSVDTNDTPNTIYSDIRSEVSLKINHLNYILFFMYICFKK